MSSQYGERRPLTAEIGLPLWGTTANFNRFRVLASLHLLGWYTIYDGILARAKFTLRPSLAFSYIDSDTARHSSSGLS